MADCFLCESFVGDEHGDGGVKGRLIGTRDICEQCLAELKYCMGGIEAKSPYERKNKNAEDEEVNEEITDENKSDQELSDEENFDPSSSGVKI
jgi:hypothetical protein